MKKPGGLNAQSGFLTVVRVIFRRVYVDVLCRL